MRAVLYSMLTVSAIAVAACADTVPVVPADVCPTPAPEGAYVEGQVKAPIKLLAVGVESPESEASFSEGTVASAVVGLADSLGHPVPGVAAIRTDAQGRYRLERLPAGHVFQVVAQFSDANGKQAVLSTTVRPATSGIQADLDLASTLVTFELAEAVEGFGGGFEQPIYQAIVDQVRTKLTDATVPDLASTAAIRARLQAIKQADPALAQTLHGLRLQVGPAAK